LLLLDGIECPLQPSLPAAKGGAFMLQAISQPLKLLLGTAAVWNGCRRGSNDTATRSDHFSKTLVNLEFDAAVLKLLFRNGVSLLLGFEPGLLDGIHLNKSIEVPLLAPPSSKLS
jgi:hypothetical protein